MIAGLSEVCRAMRLSGAFNPVGKATGVPYTRRSADGTRFSVLHSQFGSTHLSLPIAFDMSEESTRIKAGSRHLSNHLLRRHAMSCLVHVTS